MNYFKEKLIEDIVTNKMTLITTDAKSEARELLVFMTKYEYATLEEVNLCRTGFQALNESDYEEITELLHANQCTHVESAGVRKISRSGPHNNAKKWVSHI